MLRTGIVLVGIKLSLFEMLRLGLAGIPVVVAAIAAGLLFVPWLNRRLGLPPRLGSLVAAGTSICGVTAIVSTAPAIEADEREVAYAVANVVAFGLFGMLAYPYLAHALLGDSATIGLFLGTAIHDTSQVVGAALTYQQVFADDVVLRVATVTKLTRNLFLAAVVPYLAWQHARDRGSAAAPGARPASWSTYLPAFILGFVAMAILRSIGDGMLDAGRRGACGTALPGARSPRPWATPSAPAGFSGRRWPRWVSTRPSRCSRASASSRSPSAWPARSSSAWSDWPWRSCSDVSSRPDRGQSSQGPRCGVASFP